MASARTKPPSSGRASPATSASSRSPSCTDRFAGFANVLKARGLKAGDRAIIYMPMIPEAAVAMLACARLGIIHSVVFGGFSAEALKARIQDLDARIVITADGGWRRGKEVRLKTAVDEALEGCPNVHDVIVYQRTGTGVTDEGGPRSLVARPASGRQR